MRIKKGIATRELEKPHFSKPSDRAMTPPRVAPRLRTEVKNMRVRNKKNSLSGKK